MSERDQIIDGAQSFRQSRGLVYTKRCGWVDLGHADPEGPRALWIKILNQQNEGGAEQGFFRISYNQEMRKTKVKITVGAGIRKKYDIKKDLNPNDAKAVALAIFLDVSHAFESMQASPDIAA